MNNDKITALRAGYEGGTMVSEDLGGKITLHYQSAAEANNAFSALCEMLDGAAPAAASAGAAGTIDERTFHELAMDYRGASITLAALKYRDLVAHIDQHTAAAREEGRQAGIQQERALCELSAEGQAMEGSNLLTARPNGSENGFDIDNAEGFTIAGNVGKDNARRIVACWNACDGSEIEDLERLGADFIKPLIDLIDERDRLAAEVSELRAATAPVSAAPTAGDVIDISEDYIGGAPQSAGAPVSNAPDAWITPQVAQNLDRQYRDGFQAGWTACIDGNEEALGAVLNRVKPLADYQEGAPVSDQIAISLRQQREDTERIVATLSSEPSAEALEFYSSVGAPVSAAEPADARIAALRAELASLWHLRPADEQKLPAFGLTRWTVECPRSWIDPQDCVEDADGEWVKYSDVAALAMRQPDPAGEWVRRADLAMGQQGDDTARLDWLEKNEAQAYRFESTGTWRISIVPGPLAQAKTLREAIDGAIAVDSGIAAKQAGKD